MHTKFGQKTLKGRDNSEDIGVGRRTILEWILGKQRGKVWTGFIWLRIGSSGGLL
jgi:hypothetical protein